MDTQPLVVRNIDKFFGGGFDYRRLLPWRQPNGDHEPVQVLHSISFGVERGETIAFAGPSGAGKTTAL